MFSFHLLDGQRITKNAFHVCTIVIWCYQITILEISTVVFVHTRENNSVKCVKVSFNCLGSGNKVNWEQNDDPWGAGTEEPNIGYDEELFAACMRRFLYIRCYDSFEFLATLKVRNSFKLHYG